MSELKVLKASIIDWCYRVGRRDEFEWSEFGDAIKDNIDTHNPDYIFLDRVSKCWYADFIKYCSFPDYENTFIATADIDKRLGENKGGSTILIKRGNTKKFRRLKMPSSKGQMDGGHPTNVLYFKWKDKEIFVGGMPQNLGRDGTDLNGYWDLLEKFWGDGCETNAIMVPIWDKDLGLYDYHFWQIDGNDAITDDKYIVNKIQDMDVIMIIEEFGNYDGLHYDVDLSIFKTNYPIRKPKVNKLNVFASSNIDVSHHDIGLLPRMNKSSFINIIHLKDK